MVTLGVTVTLVPVKAPGFHVYVDAPDPVNVTVAFAQTVFEDAVTATVGDELTVITIVFEDAQDPLAPFTV